MVAWRYWDSDRIRKACSHHAPFHHSHIPFRSYMMPSNYHVQQHIHHNVHQVSVGNCQMSAKVKEKQKFADIQWIYFYFLAQVCLMILLLKYQNNTNKLANLSIQLNSLREPVMSIPSSTIERITWNCVKELILIICRLHGEEIKGV